MKSISLGILSVSLIAVMTSSSAFAYVSKVESIQKALKEECRINVSNKKALTLIRPLFLTCVPGTKVSVGRCDVSCLKGSGKLFVGR